MSHAEKIINIFGGTRAMAAALGLRPSTIQSWKKAGLIPAKHQQAVLDKARELGLPLTPADFFDFTTGNNAALPTQFEGRA